MRNSHIDGETGILRGYESPIFTVPVTYLKIRRLMEVLLIILFLPVLLLIMLLASIPVMLCFRGKIFFRQERAGTNGIPFTIYKFRTMNRHIKNGIDTTGNTDNSVGILGGFLRRHRIDELPQFINVLKGDMSIIGPRPEIIHEYNYYSEKIPNYRLRKKIPQGITGWAQVNFPPCESVEETAKKLRYDLEYIENINFRMDLRILFRTILLILKGRLF